MTDQPSTSPAPEGGMSPIKGADAGAWSQLTATEQAAAHTAAGDAKFAALRHARDTMNLSDAALSLLDKQTVIIQTDTGFGVEFNGKTEDGFALISPLKEGKLGHYESQKMLEALKRELGDKVHLTREPEQTFKTTSKQQKEPQVTKDGLFQMTSGEDGDLFQPVPQKDVMLYRSDAKDLNVYKAAQAEANRRGTNLKVIDDPVHPDATWQEGDITLPRNYTMEDWKEAGRLQRANPHKALWNADGKLVFPRSRGSRHGGV